jgi:putative hydrolase of the HAD superfamily
MRVRVAGQHSAPVWLFDLDNTLHDAGFAIFPHINQGMTDFVARVTGADRSTASRLRTEYWKRYGATLLGMIKHHGVDPAEFLRAAHTFEDLPAMIRAQRGLRDLLQALPGRKILLTNAPRAYAREVVRHLGIDRQFSHLIAIEDMWVHHRLRPKPDRLMLHRVLARQRIAPHSAILVEDTLSHLKRYRGLGIRTAWVTGYLRHREPNQPLLEVGERADLATTEVLAEEAARHVPADVAAVSVQDVSAEHNVMAQHRAARSNRLRIVSRPSYVNVQVKSVSQLKRWISRGQS